MSDEYIDPWEIRSYGDFAIGQIEELIVGQETDFDGALRAISKRLRAATDAVNAAVARADEHEAVTYKRAEAEGGPIANARDVVRRVARYAESRANGRDLTRSLLNEVSLTLVMKMRPTRLVGALDHAIQRVAHHKDQLPEWSQWKKELHDARVALDTLNTEVRASRTARQKITPEVADARERWLTVYAAAKSQVRVVLGLQGRLGVLSEVFDDLAEVHRAANVTDEHAPSPAPKPDSEPAQPA